MEIYKKNNEYYEFLGIATIMEEATNFIIEKAEIKPINGDEHIMVDVPKFYAEYKKI